VPRRTRHPGSPFRNTPSKPCPRSRTR
jgi:hypothetical protein